MKKGLQSEKTSMDRDSVKAVEFGVHTVYVEIEYYS